MRKFSEEFSIDEILHQLGAQIPWRTIVEIMSKSKSHEEKLWYIKEPHKDDWFRSMVLNQIAMKSYERSLISTKNTESIATSIVLKEYGKGYSRD